MSNYQDSYEQLRGIMDDLRSPFNRQNAKDLLLEIEARNDQELSANVARTIIDNFSRNNYFISEQQFRALTYGVINGNINLEEFI